MKALLLFILISMPCSAFARLGGAGDAGGGHAFSSTPEEVRAYVNQVPNGGLIAKDLLSTKVYLEVTQALNPDYAPNDIVKRVLLAMNQAEAAHDVDVVNLPIDPQPACYDHDGQLSDGATIIGKLKAPVCINVNSLARLPAESLKLEILALMYHEFTHQLGFGEKEAVEMQSYVKHYLPLALADESGGGGGGGAPLRIGGEVTMRAQDTSWIKIQCSDPDQYEQAPKGGTLYKSSVTILFPGQAAIVRGQPYGDAEVGCSDLPKIDCHPGKLTEDDVKFGDAKSVVEVGTTRLTDSSVGLSTSDPLAVIRELRQRGVCR